MIFYELFVSLSVAEIYLINDQFQTAILIFTLRSEWIEENHYWFSINH